MTARTKAAKLASKRGRPKLPASIGTREPNGRLSRRKQRTAELEHETISTVTAARMRHFNIMDVKAAADPRHGYVLGRMFMDGSITEPQHEAGLRFGEDMARYYGLTGVAFPSARAQDLFAVRTTGSEEGQSRSEAARKARDRMVELRKVLLGVGDINTGRHVVHTINLICVEDVDERRVLPSHMLLWLKQGLNRLAIHYGMAEN